MSPAPVFAAPDAASRLTLAAIGLLALTAAGVAQAEPAPPNDAEWSGSWESKPRKVMDQEVTYGLRLEASPDIGSGEVRGTLVVTSEMEVPLQSWIDQYCDGHERLEQAVEYSVRGRQQGARMELRYGSPKVSRCTCPRKCRVRDRGGKVSALLSPDRERVEWDDLLMFSTQGAGATDQSEQAALSGAWVLGPAKRLDMSERRLLQLEETRAEGGRSKLTGTYTVDTTRPLPLQSWRERFCDGADAWTTVQTYRVEGEREGGRVSLRFDQGRLLACSCPSKCRPDQKGGRITMTVGPTGDTLVDGDGVYQRNAGAEPEPEPADP